MVPATTAGSSEVQITRVLEAPRLAVMTAA